MFVFTDCHLSAQAAHVLSAHGHCVLPCLPHPTLDPAIASHPDMLLFAAYGLVLTHADYTLPIKAPAAKAIKQVVGQKYPQDVLLNAAVIGKYLVCRPDVTAIEVLELAQKNGIRILPVRQGYAKCNVCVVSPGAAITEDASIAQALSTAGIDVLHLIPGHVSLPGYPYGFIGGASGNDGKHVFFNGDLSLHPQGKEISEFCKKQKKEPISLASHALIDVGSFLFADQ